MIENTSSKPRWMPRQVIDIVLIKKPAEHVAIIDKYGIKVRNCFAFSDKNSSVRLLNNKG